MHKKKKGGRFLKGQHWKGKRPQTTPRGGLFQRRGKLRPGKSLRDVRVLGRGGGKVS